MTATGVGYHRAMSIRYHIALPDPALRQFGNIAGVMGWVTLVGIAGAAVCIAITSF